MTLPPPPDRHLPTQPNPPHRREPPEWSYAPPSDLPPLLAGADAPFAQLAAALWRQRWLSLGLVALGFTLTLVALAWWPRTYRASAALVVNYEVMDPANGKELPVGQLASYIATQVELLQTPALLLGVVDRLDLTHDADFTRGFQPPRPGIDAQAGPTAAVLPTSVVPTSADWAAQQVARALTVAPSPRGSQLIYVTFAARTPALAAAGANAVVDLYKVQDQARTAGPPGERRQRHAAELAALQAKVDAAQRAATAFQQRHGLLDDGTRTDVDVLRLASLDERLLAAQNARQVAELHAAQDPAVSTEVLGSPQAQALKAQLTAAEFRLAQLHRRFMPAHPDVHEAQVQVDEARAALAAMVRNYRDNASAGRSVAQRLEVGLRQASTEQRERVLARGRLQDEAAKYRLELTSALAVYQRALDIDDQIRFASTGPRPNVAVISRATPPLQASQPRVLTGLALGGAGTLLLAGGVPLLWDRRRRPGERSGGDAADRPGHGPDGFAVTAYDESLAPRA